MYNLHTDALLLQDPDEALQREWIQTNGLGGWSSSSLAFCNTRRYHGLLMAATRPPAERTLLVSSLDETIIINGERHELGVHEYNNNLHPKGNAYLDGFSQSLFPEWTYKVHGIQLKKTIVMINGENTVVIKYEVLQSKSAFDIEWMPLVAGRTYHSLQHEGPHLFWDASWDGNNWHNQLYENGPSIFIHIPGSTYQHAPRWFYGLYYREEKARGLDFYEDLLNHGAFKKTLKQADTFYIVLSDSFAGDRNAEQMIELEAERKRNVAIPAKSSLEYFLRLAADQFIVKRTLDDHGTQKELKTVIAGYHWFTDWARDTMISLPGLCLSTGRHDEARQILQAFAANVSMGMLPNRFQDNNEPPEYNTVDGTLWYFTAIHQYLKATDDLSFVLNELLPVLKDIIDWHFRGTRFNIKVQEDGLLYAGEEGQQLTWMDARINNWVVTPRMGRPVEIQALWYNALKIFADLLELNSQGDDANLVSLQAEKTKLRFQEIFWNEKDQCLFDNIDKNNFADPSIRPNQLFAISLPYPIIEGERAVEVLNRVSNELYTPLGIRTLSPHDAQYAGTYNGDAFTRDSHYHQGTAWAWLLGPYVDALMVCNEQEGRRASEKILNAISNHINGAGIGSVSEVFDGDFPFHPGGCIAQAWSVAELLRVMITYKLSDL